MSSAVSLGLADIDAKTLFSIDASMEAIWWVDKDLVLPADVGFAHGSFATRVSVSLSVVCSVFLEFSARYFNVLVDATGRSLG